VGIGRLWSRKAKMPTLLGVGILLPAPVLAGVMYGRISFDGIATVKNSVIG
jgi:hypothetical protein